MPALDGLRGVAILLVVSAHLAGGVWPSYQPFISGLPLWSSSGGGLVGVQLFFVLSGFLITSILLREGERTGRVDLLAFFGRRVRRLAPALLVLCAAMTLLALTASAAQRGAALDSVVEAATYSTNLHWLPASGWLEHTWSLAVEEQFYLVWPLLLIGVLPLGHRGVASLALAGIITTATLRHVAPIPDVYSQMRWDALMIGCVLAAVPLRPPRATGWAAWLVLVACSVWIPTVIPVDLYLILAVACGVVLTTSLGAHWLTHPALMHLGHISYGLYLWHVLLLRFGEPGWLGLVLSVSAAEVSYRYLEQPILRWRPAWRRRLATRPA
jgi:peptidoglycan/LPS O-acetylase OafA/YrhL